jgi:Protein of unknown function (DUF968)
MKPIRDPKRLAFIRSLPCVVCRKTRGVQAAHVGTTRGMGQKCSDLETLPLCEHEHREQHRLGLRQFAQNHNLDIVWIVTQLHRKPKLFIDWVPVRYPTYPTQPGEYSTPAEFQPFFFAAYRDEVFKLLPVSLGWNESFELAKQLCREYLIETFFKIPDSVSRRPGVAAQSGDEGNWEIRP